jgi:hypothetical protein
MAQTNTNDGRYIDWGTGAGTAAKSDTDVFTAGGESRATGTVSVTGSGSTAKYQVVGTMTASGAKTITNAGNFETSTGTTIIVHGDFSGIALGSGDSIEFTITIDPS